ncbi:ABC-type sugar transport system, substrate-binding protein, contains N-terminal xre family HTH domain [Parapedobacter luteus]|uniref:histidine kinase n=1 Tax=Parapedobacter luteus TaxID=623280 RepID=A0A1T5DV53_9SPHI|nr:substrate-binding domain-containing protein [Parapedobacter luteus]SKB75585.1 ABC-type sugar transport system, substrate-binding protein, contains N-terminal xre family HTH domain [Parapedobacter luteus]
MTYSKLGIWCCLLVALGLQSCFMQDNKPRVTIAFSQCVGDDAWRKTMLEEMKRELSFHSNVDFIYRDAENSSEKQILQLHELIKLAPDIIIVSPNEAEPLTPIIDEIFRSGTPIVVTDRKTSSGLYHAYVGADNYKIGYMAGQYLANQLRHKGRISEVTGLPGSSATIERQKGFHTALAAYPKIQVVEKINGQWLIDKAKEGAREKRAQLLSSDAIFAYNDQMALGVHQALSEETPFYSAKIMGVDALPGENNGMQFVSENILYASMLYPTGGKESVRTAMAILNGDAYQRDNILNTLVVDSSNVELMRLQTDKIISQQRDIDHQQALYATQQKIFSNQQRALHVLVVSLVLAVVFAGISFYALKANWEKNKTLETQNNEILGQQEQIMAMTRQVEEATEAKINFFTNISHEFKTPLSLMLVSLEELIKNARLSEETRRSLTLIKKNTLTLEHLVSQLIDLRRVGYENVIVKVRKQNLVVFCNNIVQAFRPLAKKKSINLRLESHVQDAELWFDRDLMEKVLYNLLSNAFKFTPEKASIVMKIVSPADKSGHIQIQLCDEGYGISPHDINHIFDPFFRSGHHANGSGIGLALCKEIVELHHGTITVNSQVNVGTTVIINLPVDDHAFQEEEKDYTPVNEHEQAMLESDKIFAVLENESSEEKEEELASDLPIREYSILIIDDHEGLLNFLSKKLSGSYVVYTASNAREGLEQAHRQVPDLIISDVLMPPGELGTEMVRKLKADVRTAHIPVILLTARDSDEQKLAGLDSLADAYMTKPFKMDHLLSLANNLIDNRKILHRRFSSDVVELRPVSKISPEDRRFLNELAALVEENIANSEMNVDYLCELLAVSRIQLYRKVKSLLDCSINDYISSRRLRKAKVLLQKGVQVNNVAYQTGFSSPAYFSTAFKNKYGVSPSLFKKKGVAALR